MSLQSHEFIECPACKQKLPPMAGRCHFCGNDLSKVARPQGPAKKVYAEYETPPWINSLYIALCIWWMIGGLIQIGQAAFEVANRKPGPFETAVAGQWTPVDIIIALIGVIGILVGLGMLFKIRSIRKYVQIISGLNLIFGLLGLLGSIFSILLVGPLGILFVLSNLLSIATAGATLWLLSETSGWAEMG